jgi:WD40 repeat protein
LQAGDIHIWDRESASYLHHIRALALGGDMTCIAWNPAANPFMFATGSHDGSVQIWTTPETPPGQSRLATQPAEQGVVDLSVPVLREPTRRFIPMREQDSNDTVVKVVPPREIVTTLPEPLNTLAARRHSWV